MRMSDLPELTDEEVRALGFVPGPGGWEILDPEERGPGLMVVDEGKRLALEPGLSSPAPRFLTEHQDHLTVEWTIDQLITEEAVAFLAGEPKTLKTWTVAAMAIGVATGVPVLGFTPAGTGPALIVQEESRSADFARRIRWLAKGMGLEPSDLGRLHIASQAGLLLDEPNGQAAIAREIDRLSPRLVVLDPLVRMHSGDEDRAREMRPVLTYLRRLQAAHGCALAVIHHMSKNRLDGPKLRPGQRLRGTGDFHALLDSGLYFDVRPGVRQVAVDVEHREAPPPEPFLIELDVDEEAGSAVLTREAGTLADVAVLAAMPAVEAVLEANPDGLIGREVESQVEGRAQVIREALRRLEASGRATADAGTREDAAGRRRKVKLWKRRSE
jgi:AAA domain